MLHTKTPGTGNKIKFVLLWIVSYIGVSLCSLMPSAATSLVASVNSVMFISQKCARSVLLIRCLSKMPPSSSTFSVHRLPPGRGDLWREQRRNFSCDLLPLSTRKMFVRSPAIPLWTRFSAIFSSPSLTTVWSNYQTLFNNFFEVYITKMVTLSANVQTVLWPV